MARHTPLAILTDLDGTLIPFSPHPDQTRVPAELSALLQSLALRSGIQVAVVSGRPREALDRFFPASPAVWLVAEHGGWRRADGAWTEALPGESRDLDGLQADLERLVARVPGSLVERKTWALALHFRMVAPADRGAFLVEASEILEAWLRTHEGFERLEGAAVLEVRAARIRKSLAVPWLREKAGAGARLIVLGDDVTDEDMFGAVGTHDEAIRVGPAVGRATRARWTLGGPEEAIAFLRWIDAARHEGPTPAPVHVPRPIARDGRREAGPAAPHRLLAISNRLPDLRAPTEPGETRKKNVGGLVSALEPVLTARNGLWLGWSGRTDAGGPAAGPGFDDSAAPALAWIDLSRDLHRRYYNGFSNGALWPLFHTFPARVAFHDEDWEAYVRVNDLFAEAARSLVPEDTPIWIHDYHLLLLGAALRRRGHRGPVGLFLHIPFPGPDLFRMIPWSDRILEDLLACDLLGFHTPNDVANVLQCAGSLSPAKVGDDAILHRGHRTRVRAFPIGIIPEGFQEAPDPDVADEAAALIRSIGTSELILGIDRLDYTKGIPERLEAFARLLVLFPEWRGKVAFVQISVPSRADVPEYKQQRNRIEAAVGRINGEFGEAHWTPVRYLYRSYNRNQLAQFYRAARVGMVTPLRDGMNLVAKEYVAAQTAANPGVLLLSRFAGAAVELRDALLTNPWHIDGMARDLDRALRMPLPERLERHAKLAAIVRRTTALTWAEDFVGALEACR